MFDMLTLFRALSDENRLRILLALKNHPLCVCEIASLLELAQSTTSKHLSILRQARLLEQKRHKRRTYYTLPTESPPQIQEVLHYVNTHLEQSGQAQKDAIRLTEILESMRDPHLHKCFDSKNAIPDSLISIEMES